MTIKMRAPDELAHPPKKMACLFSRNEVMGEWESVGDELLVFTPFAIQHVDKIAGFDMGRYAKEIRTVEDGTLTKTKSGNVFPKDYNDWQLWHPLVPKKLRKLHNDGFKICIFTNQRGIQTKNCDAEKLKAKILRICQAIGVPIQVFVSPGPATYRKPCTGMWEYMEEKGNGDVPVDRSLSFFVGDAAGRTKSKTRTKADHSAADRLFALNLGLDFKTPEQFFEISSQEEHYVLPSFSSVKLLENKTKFTPEDVTFPYRHCPNEVIVLVGPPASGKSFLSHWLNTEFGYEIVNQDTLGNKMHCLKAVEKALDQGKSVVVDNTNRDAKTRQEYVVKAKNHSVPVRAIVVDCTFSQSKHMNTFRQIVGTDKAHQNKPNVTEGFDQVITYRIVPEFNDSRHQKVGRAGAALNRRSFDALPVSPSRKRYSAQAALRDYYNIPHNTGWCKYE